MNDEQPAHLSQISTLWSVVTRAHEGEPDEMNSARDQLLRRYGGAVYRYLLKTLRDPEAAGELSQEFALRFVRGDFRRADPERGRFRHYLKSALINLVHDHRQRERKRPRALTENDPEPSSGDDLSPGTDQEFAASWREALLARAWEELAAEEERTRQPIYTVLRFRFDNPTLASAQAAEQLGARLGRPLTAVWVRQALHQARKRFADLLLDEVAHSLESPTYERLEEELEELGLLEYCKPALVRRGGS
jgi:RNA polymerase sigma-70 factor (ECF subfamily)